MSINYTHFSFLSWSALNIQAWIPDGEQIGPRFRRCSDHSASFSCTLVDSTQISLRGRLHVAVHSRIGDIYLSNSKPVTANRITVLSLNWLFFPLIIHFRMLRSRTGCQNYCNDPTNRLWCFVASMPGESWTCSKNPSKCDMQHKKDVMQYKLKSKSARLARNVPHKHTQHRWVNAL